MAESCRNTGSRVADWLGFLDSYSLVGSSVARGFYACDRYAECEQKTSLAAHTIDRVAPKLNRTLFLTLIHREGEGVKKAAQLRRGKEVARDQDAYSDYVCAPVISAEWSVKSTRTSAKSMLLIINKDWAGEVECQRGDNVLRTKSPYITPKKNRIPNFPYFAHHVSTDFTILPISQFPGYYRLIFPILPFLPPVPFVPIFYRFNLFLPILQFYRFALHYPLLLPILPIRPFICRKYHYSIFCRYYHFTNFTNLTAITHFFCRFYRFYHFAPRAIYLIFTNFPTWRIAQFCQYGRHYRRLSPDFANFAILPSVPFLPFTNFTNLLQIFTFYRFRRRRKHLYPVLPILPFCISFRFPRRNQLLFPIPPIILFYHWCRIYRILPILTILPISPIAPFTRFTNFPAITDAFCLFYQFTISENGAYLPIFQIPQF